MTEMEKIAYAKSFIDKLAEGINPLDGTPIPEGDIVNNSRLTRCFFYVSDILRQVIENGGVNRDGKIPFSITAEQLARYNFPPYPVGVSEISKQLAALADNPAMKAISPIQINNWLEAQGYLVKVLEQNTGKNRRLPTQSGEALGITLTLKQNREGQAYSAVEYNENAQRFILSNLDEIKVFVKTN
ncbi:MAG: hypothetical protein IJB57_03385 [Clostridia bacterium]|nr:hypothetical protein [Clostridia bacterium]